MGLVRQRLKSIYPIVLSSTPPDYFDGNGNFTSQENTGVAALLRLVSLFVSFME